MWSDLRANEREALHWTLLGPLTTVHALPSLPTSRPVTPTLMMRSPASSMYISSLPQPGLQPAAPRQPLHSSGPQLAASFSLPAQG